MRLVEAKAVGVNQTGGKRGVWKGERGLEVEGAAHSFMTRGPLVPRTFVSYLRQSLHKSGNNNGNAAAYSTAASSCLTAPCPAFSGFIPPSYTLKAVPNILARTCRGNY